MRAQPLDALAVRARLQITACLVGLDASQIREIEEVTRALRRFTSLSASPRQPYFPTTIASQLNFRLAQL